MTELFATGIQMGESPRWHDGRFWMCDWLAGEILAFESDGTREVVGRIDGLPVSIDWLPDGRLVATSPAGMLVGPDLEPYGAARRPFNEVVVDGAGRAWVDMPGSMPWEPRLPGIVAVVLPDGSVREVADDVWFPNGMVVIDETTLIVAESHADRLTAWTITDGAELVERRVWADLGPGSAPDGICADAEGAIWYASVPGRRCTRGSPRAAGCSTRSASTAAASRACSAATTAGPCSSWPTTTTAAVRPTASSTSGASTRPTPLGRDPRSGGSRRGHRGDIDLRAASRRRTAAPAAARLPRDAPDVARRRARARRRPHRGQRRPARLRGQRLPAVHRRPCAVLEADDGGRARGSDARPRARPLRRRRSRSWRTGCVPHGARPPAGHHSPRCPGRRADPRRLGARRRSACARVLAVVAARPAAAAPRTAHRLGTDAVIDDALGGWGSAADAFPPAIRAAYVDALTGPEHIHAICEEYRAAATIDRTDDRADRDAGRRIGCPVLALWSDRGALAEWYEAIGGPLAVWRSWADDVAGGPLAGGHFFPEEHPQETAAALRRFLLHDHPPTQGPGDEHDTAAGQL